ncbi:hypothetical protein Pmani_015459 [Petrolisthes manimaculis]|uniref:Mab-21-like nucleotidyltransferase domain-containing protein n=1 Tax=Petrolisthes manimaculis TaxID=1843537 RepID=A0AAE1UBK6_9EUCA|nr:hypothetical protein Pmani_015459 [Petrolisthes manimaculis]
MAYYSCNNEFVEEVLEELHDINNEVDGKKEEVHSFLQTLQWFMKEDGDAILQDTTFDFAGSAYEGTAVSKVTDFDILLILPEPYVADNFVVYERHEPGIYKLKWRDEYDERPNGFVNGKGYLEAKKLREYTINKLKEVVKDVKKDHPHWKIHFKKMLNSLTVYITDFDGDRLKLDIVVQMGEPNWGQLANMTPEEELPSVLESYLENDQYSLFYSLAPHNRFMVKNDYHLLLSTSFSTLEKHCMNESYDVRAAVLLAKLVSQDRGWKKDYGLRSFHFKRVAIKHYEELDGLNIWSGFQRLLKYLAEQLENAEIEGFFINDQDIFNKDGNQCTNLAREIKQAKSDVKPNNMWNLLPSSDSETDSDD